MTDIDAMLAQALKARLTTGEVFDASEIENMQWSATYAEPGYDAPPKGILIANWNNLRGIEQWLGDQGYSLEWSDEWTFCDDCNAAMRTQADSYDWRPSFIETDNGCLCKSCAADA